ncbi:MAG: nucleoside triphosphate pyrophosphohydrolase [Phycisphaeraceae bacterium]|nr:nucleoside triphosphate pyrophosphohydrolase [Phycisphaeraceae bacterium]
MKETDWTKELIKIMAQLRGEDGCPWDREQTHESLKRYLVEETAELLDAIDEQDDAAIKDELGDVLLNVLFHAQIACEEQRFNIQDVARNTCEKLIRRHPHVFGDTTIDTPEGVKTQWEQIKQIERQDKAQGHELPASALHGVPKHLPALHRAHKVLNKAARAGFEWPTVEGVMAKIHEELAEVQDAIERQDRKAVAEEIGDLLFAVTNLGRFLDHFSEQALHHTIHKFEQRFKYIEQQLLAKGKLPQQCDLDELMALWIQAKDNPHVS